VVKIVGATTLVVLLSIVIVDQLAAPIFRQPAVLGDAENLGSIVVGAGDSSARVNLTMDLDVQPPGANSSSTASFQIDITGGGTGGSAYIAIRGPLRDAITTCGGSSTMQRDRRPDTLPQALRTALQYVSLRTDERRAQVSTTNLLKLEEPYANDPHGLITLKLDPSEGGGLGEYQARADCLLNTSSFWTQNGSVWVFSSPWLAAANLNHDGPVISAFIRIHSTNDMRLTQADPSLSSQTLNLVTWVPRDAHCFGYFGTQTCGEEPVAALFASASHESLDQRKLFIAGIVVGVVSSLLVSIGSKFVDVVYGSQSVSARSKRRKGGRSKGPPRSSSGTHRTFGKGLRSRPPVIRTKRIR
jgi:hypothetical protein